MLSELLRSLIKIALILVRVRCSRFNVFLLNFRGMISLDPWKGVEMLVYRDGLFSDSVIKSDMNVKPTRSAEGFVQLVRVICRGEKN